MPWFRETLMNGRVRKWCCECDFSSEDYTRLRHRSAHTEPRERLCTSRPLANQLFRTPKLSSKSQSRLGRPGRASSPPPPHWRVRSDRCTRSQVVTRKRNTEAACNLRPMKLRQSVSISTAYSGHHWGTSVHFRGAASVMRSMTQIRSSAAWCLRTGIPQGLYRLCSKHGS